MNDSLVYIYIFFRVYMFNCESVDSLNLAGSESKLDTCIYVHYM